VCAGEELAVSYDEIRQMPTTIKAEQWRTGDLRTASGVHESALRAYHIVAKVKWLLELKTDPQVVLELLRVMESA
jgi:hypothetical protein